MIIIFFLLETEIVSSGLLFTVKILKLLIFSLASVKGFSVLFDIK